MSGNIDWEFANTGPMREVVPVMKAHLKHDSRIIHTDEFHAFLELRKEEIIEWVRNGSKE